jgi:hypothetical protein
MTDYHGVGRSIVRSVESSVGKSVGRLVGRPVGQSVGRGAQVVDFVFGGPGAFLGPLLALLGALWASRDPP